MVNEHKLPEEIYFIVDSHRMRPYVHQGHVKLALKGRFWYSRKSVCVYVCKPYGHHGTPTGWVDITSEFLDEEGNPTW